jgi:hypothetical protein
MIIERKESLTVLPVWDEKKIRRTRHFCGRAHASRYVERWIANPGFALIPDVVSEAESNRVTSNSRVEEERFEDDPAETKKIEQMLMQDENGEELSSARIVPNAPSKQAPLSPTVYAVPTPAPCALPPALTHVSSASFVRRLNMM